MMVSTAHRIAIEAHAVATVVRAGMIGLSPTLPQALQALSAFGPIGGGIRSAAMRFGDRTGLVDELGTLTFAELDGRSNALADSWRRRGIGEGTGIGILCRNHRGFLDATFAAAKIGARALFLNTDFSGPQAVDVCTREGVDVIVYDAEFADVVAGVRAPKGRFLAWTADQRDDGETLESLIATGTNHPPAPPAKPGSVVLLTSGTTGTPKGAPRPQPKSFALPATILSRLPLRGGQAIYVAPPMFHGWGFLTTMLGIGVGATVVTRRRFDPSAVLDTVHRQRCRSLVVVPVLLERLLALGAEEIRGRDLSALRAVAISGAPLTVATTKRTTELLGEVVYDFYGTTECGYAGIATPRDKRAAPASVGRPPFGVTVKILDADGREVPRGTPGRIFVGNTVQFTGYTGGGTKEIVGGLMSTGDMGHLDAAGRLFVDGRDDDMIVSGGENVFPQEVEELLAAHPAVTEAAVLGIDDAEFGQALHAFVVRTDTELDEAALRAHVKNNLARYKVPRRITFTDELPRNPAGKVLKRVLREGEIDRT